MRDGHARLGGNAVTREASRRGHRFSAIVLEIVDSVPFRMRRGFTLMDMVPLAVFRGAVFFSSAAGLSEATISEELPSSEVPPPDTITQWPALVINRNVTAKKAILWKRTMGLRQPEPRNSRIAVMQGVITDIVGNKGIDEPI